MKNTGGVALRRGPEVPESIIKYLYKIKKRRLLSPQD